MQPLALLIRVLALLAIGCVGAKAGQLRSVDEYKFRDLVAGCWNASDAAQAALEWQRVCFGSSGSLVMSPRDGGASQGSYRLDAEKLVIEAPFPGQKSPDKLTCDAVVRPYSGLALRHCTNGQRSFADVEFSYDNEKAGVLLGCWDLVDDDIFPESICFDTSGGFETSVLLPDAREGFGSPGTYSLKADRLTLATDYPHEGWLWEEHPSLACTLEVTDARHMALVDCDGAVQPTQFSREDGV